MPDDTLISRSHLVLSWLFFQINMDSLAHEDSDPTIIRSFREYEEGYNSEQSALDVLATHTSTSLPVSDQDPTNPVESNEEPLDFKFVGMSIGYKDLYAGKQDRFGRFQWQETVPEDLAPSAENAETQK